MTHLGIISEMLVGMPLIRYSRHKDRLYVDIDWNKVVVGNYLLIQAYEVVDPDTFTDAWGDRWLAKYATALIKKQWGSNLTKFSGLQLPGGVTFNGEKIYDDADAEVQRIEEEMINSNSLPVMDMMN
jgi:hypothetical protein